jgi:hypothetical protein
VRRTGIVGSKSIEVVGDAGTRKFGLVASISRPALGNGMTCVGLARRDDGCGSQWPRTPRLAAGRVSNQLTWDSGKSPVPGFTM